MLDFQNFLKYHLVMKLSQVQQEFVAHWGEMGTRWGINRTMAQIHAVLFLSDRPLHAEELVDAVGVARSNVSVCLRELQGWRIVRKVMLPGDRRDHFESMTDVWAMFQVILEERKQREVDPTVALLKRCVDDAKKDSPHVQQRLGDMLDFFERSCSWYDQVSRLPPKLLKRFFAMGAKLGGVLRPKASSS